MFYKYVIHEADLPIGGIYNFYVQELHSIDGKIFYHVGYTKYFQDRAAAEAYRAEMQAARPLPGSKEEETGQNGT